MWMCPKNEVFFPSFLNNLPGHNGNELNIAFFFCLSLSIENQANSRVYWKLQKLFGARFGNICQKVIVACCSLAVYTTLTRTGGGGGGWKKPCLVRLSVHCYTFPQTRPWRWCGPARRCSCSWPSRAAWPWRRRRCPWGRRRCWTTTRTAWSATGQAEDEVVVRMRGLGWPKMGWCATKCILLLIKRASKSPS